MHELSLYGAIPPSKHHITLSILAGLTSMQPQPVLERRLDFLPTREPGTPVTPAFRAQAEKKGVPAAFIGDTFRVQVVGDVSEGAEISANDGGSDFERYAFRCEFKDFPEVPAKRPATSRVVGSMRVLEGKRGYMLDFMDGVGYKYSREMIQAGERFTHGNIDIRLLRTYPLPQASTPLDILPKTTQNLKAFDPSDSFAVQATLLVAEDGKPEVMTNAFAEMERLKEMLKGIVDLSIGDRLVMNTRIRREVR